MKKQALSSVIIAMLATLAVVPVAPVSLAHADPASITVTPTVLAGNPGDTFTVEVDMNNVNNLVAYDISLNYNGQSLSATSVDFTGPFTGSGCTVFPIIESSNNAVGLVRVAITTFSGCSVSVFSSPVLVVSFTNIARQNSPLHVSTDTECACSALASINGSGDITPVAHTSTDGFFFAEPNIVFHTTFFVTTTPRQPKVKLGQTSTVLSANLRLDKSEALAGFTLVVFDIITPSGADITISSNEIFLLPGSQGTVSATYTFGSVTGTYLVFGTLWRGGAADPPALVPFEMLQGQNFQVH